MEPALIAIVFASALSYLFSKLLIPFFNRFLRSIGIVGRDVMKRERPEVVDMGGPGVMFGFVIGIFFFIAMEIFIFGELPVLIYILASVSTILIITLIGIFDVLTSLMEQKEGTGMFERMKRRGIPAWVYYMAPLPAAIPLSAVNAGVSSMRLPYIGNVDIGVLYPMILIPLAVLCCTNATNFLAGFNGLEAGMGLVLHVSLGVYAAMLGEYDAALLALTFAAALLAFLRYNWYPAEVFPGDLNYTIGAVCVCVTVIGDMERFAILCFVPWIIEAVLKAKSRFQAESYGVLQKDGTVKRLTGEIGSLTHLAMSLGRFTEPQIASMLIIVEVAVCVISFLFTQFV